MALRFYIDGMEIPDTVTVIGGLGPLTESAHAMTMSTGGVIFDDPEGDLDIVPWKSYWVEEDDCSQPRIYSGYIAEIRITRGPYKTEAGRIWDCDLVDLNTLLDWKIGQTADAQRPAESSAARLAWLMGSRLLTGKVFDNGFIDDAVTYPMGEANYRDSKAHDVLTDLIAPRHKNAYVFWDEGADAGEEPTLFFDDIGSTVRASTLSISNVRADVAASPTTVGAPDMAAALKYDPSAIYAGVRLKTRVGDFFGYSAATAAAYADRETVVNNDRIGQVETAQAVVANYLNEHDAPFETLSCTVQLPSTRVGLIRAGHALNVRFTHLPRYETATPVVVTRCTVRQTESAKEYLLDLEMSNETATGGGGGPPVGPLPPPEECEADVRQFAYEDGETWNVATGSAVAWGTPPLSGSVGFVSFGLFESAEPPLTVPAGWTQVSTTTGYNGEPANQEIYRFVSDGTQSFGLAQGLEFTDGNTVRWCMWELTGVESTQHDVSRVFDQHASSNPTIGVAVPDGQKIVIYAAGHDTAFGDGPWNMETDYTTVRHTPAGAHPRMMWGHRIFSGAAGTENATEQVIGLNNQYGGYAISFAADTSACGDPDPPDPGEEVPWEEAASITPGATTTDGTTRFPYLPGTLKIRVDGVDILPQNYTETDPAAGEFSLHWVIDSTETVTVSYQGI